MPNWVDLAILIVFWRGCYGGLARGLFPELVRLAVAVVITALTLNYAGIVIVTVQPLLGGGLLAQFLLFLAFFLTLVLIARLTIRQVAKLTELDKRTWGLHALGLLVGGVRGLWWAGCLTVLLVSTGVPYLRASVMDRSLIGGRLTGIAERTLVGVADRFPGAGFRSRVLIPPVVR
ncbi:MAG TPA: CvpA family protein [bacterium]